MAPGTHLCRAHLPTGDGLETLLHFLPDAVAAYILQETLTGLQVDDDCDRMSAALIL